MKPYILAALILLAATASAQETYSLPASANNVTVLAGIVEVDNVRTCQRLKLADACTQADACVAASAAGGSGCSNAQARAANARIYPASQAGREEYVLHGVLAPWLQDRKSVIAAWHEEKRCKYWTASNQTIKDAMCVASNLPAPCSLCGGN